MDEVIKIIDEIYSLKNINIFLTNLKACEVHLYPDFAPLSLYFEVIKNEEVQLCGGIIYHGKHDAGGNGSAPTYSVSLSPCVGWRIHS